jgi:hypothetical protein
MSSLYTPSLSDMHLMSILMTLSTKLEPQLDRFYYGSISTTDVIKIHMQASSGTNSKNVEIIHYFLNFLKLHPLNLIKPSGMLQAHHCDSRV